MTRVTGGCLCGAVRYTADLETNDVGACHCAMCRRWSGGPLFAVHTSKSVAFEGDSLGVFGSSDWAERGFCTTCGSNIFYRLKPPVETPLTALSAGTLDDPSALNFNLELYVDIKPDWYAFKGDRETMTEAEVIAKFAPPSA